MASKLKVEDLRDELAQRGLSTIGIKPTLVRRLESAIRKDARQYKAETDGSMPSRKRERSSEDGDLVEGPEKIVAVEKFREMSVKKLREEAKLLGISATGTKKELLERLCCDLEKKTDETVEVEVDRPEKIMAVEKFREMGVKKLREEANLRGISATGTKKELLERLCSDSEKKTDEIVEAKEEVEDEKKERRVVATKKGAAVLDEWLPDHIKTHYHVLQQGDDIYDAMLNQTNVGDNNNKFYVIQLLESDDGSAFMVYNRWGRVGIKGQNKLHGPFTARDGAMQEFEMKFYAKTKNHWSDRKSFVSYPKCYAWLEMDYNKKEPESNVTKMTESSIAIQPRETQLETRVAKFISLVCNVSMMKQQMMEIGYNADKLPLGKLSKTTILKGYDVLKRIADVIDQSDRKTLEQLSGEFYTVIPHDFGFKKMREFVIDTPQKLKRKLEMVEALGEIEVATKLLKEDIEMLGDPLYAQYKRLQCDLTPLETESKEFNMIAKYMRNTHAKTHSNYSVDIAQIFRVSKEGEAERYRKFSSTKNRMLLWHGSRLSNWTGILSQGLRIAPPEAPVTGYMFGKGVYFADMFSKSANYCYTSRAATTGVLLLCEVALGDMAELQAAKYDADKLPDGKLSTKGVGSTAPDLSECEALEDGIVVPLGKPKEQPVPKGALLYNEYIVYNVDQIRMRYVVQVNFKYKR